MGLGIAIVWGAGGIACESVVIVAPASDSTGDAGHAGDGGAAGQLGGGGCVGEPCDDVPCANTMCGDECVDLRRDPNHCGACDHACAPGRACGWGTCCAEGFVACEALCLDPRHHPTFCGASGDCLGPRAGTVCEADEVCAEGVCGCAEGYIRCDGLCTNPAQDRDHCGASGDCTGANAGVACDPGRVCVDGVCGCSPGSIVCNDVCTDPATDSTHCGATDDCMGANAGTACAPGFACETGACVPVPLVIDFDDVVAPTVFVDTQPLSNEYAALGVTFTGPGPALGGARLNANSFTCFQNHSEPNALMFGGTYAESPETITFDPPVVSVKLLVSGQAGDIDVVAKDATGRVVDTAAVTLVCSAHDLELTGAAITDVVVTGPLYFGVDDLRFVRLP